jgi:hypothetical protein
MFDNSDEVNKNISLKIERLKIKPNSSNKKGKRKKYLKQPLRTKLTNQEDCKDDPYQGNCTGCKNGFFAHGVCLNSENTKIIVDSFPKFVKNSSLNEENSLKINLSNYKEKSLKGFSISFSFRRFVIEDTKMVPLLSLYNEAESVTVITVEMDNNSILFTNKLSNSSTKVNLPSSNMNLHFLREYFVSISVNLELRNDKIHVSSYIGNQKLNNSDEEETSATNDYFDLKEDLSLPSEDLKILLGVSGKKESNINTNFYIHSLFFDPDRHFLRSLRVRKPFTCDTLCKVSCTGGICPKGMNYPERINLSVSSFKKDMLQLKNNLPLYRKITYNEPSITNDVIVDEFMLEISFNLNDLESFNANNKFANNHLLFSLKSSANDAVKSLKLSDLAPEKEIESSILSVRINPCDKKEKFCDKVLTFNYGYFENKIKTFKVVLEKEKTIQRISFAAYVKTFIKEKKYKSKLSSRMYILVKQNNNIILEEPLDMEMNASITNDSVVFTHPAIGVVNLDMVEPNLNKMLWEYLMEDVNDDPNYNVCGHDLVNDNKHCQACFDKKCFRCSLDTYLDTEGRCQKRKFYLHDE